MAIVLALLAPARGQGLAEDEALRLRAQVEALKREVAEIRGELARAQERLARLEAERGARPAGTGPRIAADAHLRYVMEAVLPRLVPEGLDAQGEPLFEPRDKAAERVRARPMPPELTGLLKPLLASGEVVSIAFAAYGTPLLGKAASHEKIAVFGFEFAPGEARRAWPWGEIREISPWQWILFADDFVIVVADERTSPQAFTQQSAAGRVFPEALERAAAPLRLVHASEYPDLILQAARADIAGKFGRTGAFKLTQAPAPDGFFARALGEAVDLREDDVIREVNGIAIEPSLTVPALFARLRSERRFDLLIDRGKKSFILRCEARGTTQTGAPAEPSKGEQEALVRRLEALLAELDAAVAGSNAGAAASAWTAADDLARGEHVFTLDPLRERWRVLLSALAGRLGAARGLLAAALRSEGEAKTKAMRAELEREGFGRVFALFEQLEGKATRMAEADVELGVVAAELRDRARPLFEEARVRSEATRLPLVVTAGLVTTGGVSKVVINGRALAAGEGICDPGGAPIPGLRIAEIRDGHPILELRGVRFEPRMTAAGK